jgi:hypothetical protein
MTKILSYHVFATRDGGLWLAEDEKTWKSNFDKSARFFSAKSAVEIAAREAAKGNPGAHYVFAWVGDAS